MKGQSVLALSSLLVAALAVMVACNGRMINVRGTFDVRIETTPGPEATQAALEAENAWLTTQVAELETRSNLGRLAYVHGGDVWVKRLPDGEPQRLTEDGRNTGPSWSPSGDWLTFHKEDEVWVMRANGAGARRVAAASPQDTIWSPVDDRLTYIAGRSSLRVIEPDALGDTGLDGEGHVVLQLAIEEQPSTTIQYPAWSPDGRRLAYVLRIGQPGALPDHLSIGYVDLEAGPRELYAPPSPPQDGLILAGWTPDGQSLLLWHDPMFSASAAADGLPLLRLPVDGGEPVEVTVSTLLHSDFWSSSPTGQQMALTVGAGRETWTNKRIGLLDADIDRASAETAGWEYLTGETVAAFSPAFSPDGGQIAYVAAPDAGHVWGGDEAKAGAAQRRIWVMSVDGSDQRPLTDAPAYRDERPLWSADGAHVLFARMDEEGHASVWLVDAAGGTPERVVEELTPAPEWFGYYGHIDWCQWFDWWRDSAGQPGDSARDATPPPTVTLMPTPTQWFPPTPTPRPPASVTPASATVIEPLPARPI